MERQYNLSDDEVDILLSTIDTLLEESAWILSIEEIETLDIIIKAIKAKRNSNI